jgi:uncharacterized protein
MRVNVAKQLKEPVGSLRAFEFEGQVEHASVVGRAALVRTDAGILVQARCQTQAVWTCGRCATSYVQPLDLTIEEEFFPTTDVKTGAVLLVEEEAYQIDSTHTLDLTEAVREYTLLAGPIQPLCRPGCAGLCPACGTNLNEAACSCSVDASHPVLADLERRWAEQHAS